MELRRRDFWIFVACGMFLLGRVYLFYGNLSTTLSPFSQGDIAYYNQVLYRFVQTGEMQTEWYAQMPFEPPLAPRGAAETPAWAVHVNLSPFLFAPVYALYPDFQGLYAILLLWNFGILALFTVLWVWGGAASQAVTRILLCLSVLCASSIFEYVTYKGHFILFAGPVLLPLFYFAWRGQRVLFGLAALFIALTSEDAALILGGISLGAALCWRARRAWFAAAGLLALAWFAACAGILQPWARAGLGLRYASHFLYVLAERPGVGGYSYYPLAVLLYTGLVAVAARLRYAPSLALVIPLLLYSLATDKQIKVAYDIWFLKDRETREELILRHRERIHEILVERRGQTVCLPDTSKIDAYVSSRLGIQSHNFGRAACCR